MHVLTGLAQSVGGLATRTALEQALSVSELDVSLDWHDPERTRISGLPQEQLPLATAIVIGAQRSIRLVERIAGASRAGHRRSKALRQQLHDLALPGMVSSSVASRELVAMIRAVAPLPTTVLLTGETGTGKELVARQLHRLSRRDDKPFVALNCAAIPDDLFESVLLGHERGAFTGADKLHRGAVERAGAGTLFLDEIGEMSPAAQAKMLRLLQEREFERVGGAQTLGASCRFVAATHRSLEAMVRAGTFRQDLLYRLSVFPIHCAPLRERPEDLVELVELLVDRVARRHGRAAPKVTMALRAELLQHDWPGNVRELENILERAMILSPGRELALPAGWRGGEPVEAQAEAPRTLAEAERECIVTALRHTSGRLYGPGGAAELTGLKPSTLQWRMKKLGIDRGAFTAS